MSKSYSARSSCIFRRIALNVLAYFCKKNFSFPSGGVKELQSLYLECYTEVSQSLVVFAQGFKTHLCVFDIQVGRLLFRWNGFHQVNWQLCTSQEVWGVSEARFNTSKRKAWQRAGWQPPGHNGIDRLWVCLIVFVKAKVVITIVPTMSIQWSWMMKIVWFIKVNNYSLYFAEYKTI